MHHPEQTAYEPPPQASGEQWRVLAETVPQFVWATRPDGYLEYWNQRFADFLGAAPEALQGYAWRQFLHPEERDAVVATRTRSLERGEPYEIEYHLREGRTGTYRWFLTRAAPVRDASGQIIRWFGTCTDIENQKRIEENLRQSQEHARELEQRKDNFISMASHELKTPLTSLKLQTQLLGRQLAKQGNSHSVLTLARMEEQLKHLERLVGELLDVSKIQADRIEFLQEPVDLDTLLHTVVETIQQMNTTHILVVRGSVQTTLIGDKGWLEQAFINLLSNAIKYSPDGSTVEVEIDTDEESVIVSVSDHGIGIPEEQHAKVFERFYRAFDPGQKAIPGLGMGLYIAAEIIKSHSGTITVNSAIGKGSTFQVTLPLKRPDAT